jgi:exopolysaccharide biosynthesis WecB/TagA/CpsF family protein
MSVVERLKLVMDDYDTQEFVRLLAARRGKSFEYVVTPNVDHIIRYFDDIEFRQLYAGARFRLLDSRLLALILRITRGISARVCPGSDLTAGLFAIAEPDDCIVLVGGTRETADRLAHIYRLKNLRHYAPPMGFVSDPAAFEQTLEFIEAQSPARFCFLAVGSPQQERVASELQRRGHATGVALCIGASVNFLTGSERRAPRWMQLLALEWFYRLLQNPKRMGPRYLLRGPRIFRLLPRIEFDLRRVRGAGA